MMMVNSVAMFTIACSLFQLGFGGVLHSAISSENTVTSLPPIKMMNTTTSTIAPIIPDKKSAIQTVESSTALLEKIRDILGIKKDDVKNQAVNVSNDNAQAKQYFQLLKKNIELLDLHEKFKTLQSRVLELENDQTHQRNIIKEKDILISELSLGTQELSAKLYQSQQELLNITKHYNDLEKSYLTAQKKIETHNDELENEKKKHSVELLNSSTEISQLKEKNEKCMNQQEELEKSLETAKSDFVKNNETQSKVLDLKSAELENLKQKNSIELLNLSTEVEKLKENNKKCTDQQEALEKYLIATESDLVKNTKALFFQNAELENLKKKSTAGFKWVEYSGYHQVEPGMVEIGRDHGNYKLVVGRATHNGDILPAKVRPENGAAFVSYNGVEYEKAHYEIMFRTDFEWVPVENGPVPSNAFPVGKTIDGKILYVGRTVHDGVDCAGKVDPTSNKLIISYAGEEIEYTSYQVLVMH